MIGELTTVERGSGAGLLPEGWQEFFDVRRACRDLADGVDEPGFGVDAAHAAVLEDAF